MRVLILSSCAETFLFYREDMMRAMLSEGHEVIAASPGSETEWSERFGALGIKYISIEGIDRNGKNPLQDMKGLFAIIKAIRDTEPDRIFAFQAKTVIYGAIAARICGVKRFYAMMAGLGSVLRGSNVSGLIRRILLMEYRLAYLFSRKVFFQNDDDASYMLTRGIVRPEQIVRINGTGVNMDKFSHYPVENRHEFLFVGRLLRDKGIMEYLEAAQLVKARFPEVTFRVVGGYDTNPSGIEKQVFEQYVRQGIIEYTGEVQDVRPYLKSCEVFVLPSYHEGTPKSVLEAMSTGRAIITTDAPGCRDTVVDGLNGFSVPVGDSDALAERMIWMIENSDAAVSMGLESLDICRQKYDVRLVNATILQTMEL